MYQYKMELFWEMFWARALMLLKTTFSSHGAFSALFEKLCLLGTISHYHKLFKLS